MVGKNSTKFVLGKFERVGEENLCLKKFGRERMKTRGSWELETAMTRKCRPIWSTEGGRKKERK